MKKDRIVKSLMVLMGWVCCSLILGSGVMAQGTVNGTDAVGVAYRGHIQDYGDQPADEAWLDGDAQLGTTGESKRIEGFWIKLTGTENLPAGAGIRYNVHVQNVGWLASTDLTKTETWVANGDFAGSQSKSQRVEAIQIVLTGADGKVLPGYSVQYQVHIQDYGWSQGWKADGVIAGTSGESKRLEAIQIKIVKTETDPAADESVVYDQAGTNGPATGTQTIAGDVTVAADGVILQNLVIQGDLTISEAVGDGNVTLNNVTVKGDTFVRGGGVNSIKINGGEYSRIVLEKTASGAVRIVAIDVKGLPFVVSEAAAGETIILEGAFDSVTVNAPNMTVTTQGDTTTIGKMTVGAEAAGSAITLNAGTTVTDLVLDGKTAAIKGQGTVTRAEVNADSAVFEKAPGSYAVESDVVIPPVFPSTDSGGGGGGGGYTPPSKIALSISDPTVTLSRVYDGTRNAAVTTTGTLTGIETGDIVQVTATASYDSKNVDTGKTITVTYILTGANAAKYTAPVDKTITGGTITTIPLTAATPTVTKVYDGSLTSSAVTIGTGLVSGDAVTVGYTATYTDANVGTGKPVSLSYTLSGTDAGNYTTPAGDANATGEITRKTLTVSDNGLVNFDKVYDGTTAVPGLVGAIDSAKINGVVSGETVVVKATGIFVDPNVGVHDINVSFSLSGTDKDHYQISSKTITGKIAPIQLTATAAEVTTSKTYDGKTTAVITDNGAFGGILGSDNGKVTVTPTASYSDINVDTGKTITVTYALSGTAAGNYTQPQGYELKTGVITAKLLTIAAPTPISKPYDGDTTAKVTAGNLIGVESGDSANVTVATVASYDNKNAGTNKTVTVVYTLDGSAASNYTKPENDVLATGEITKIQLHATLASITTEKVYNGTASVNATCSGLDEVLDVYNAVYNSYTKELVSINLDVHYDSKNVGDRTITINYPLNDTEAAKNYLAPATETRSGKITPVQLTATGAVVTPTKIYDSGTTAAITNAVTIGGILSTETPVNVTAVANYNDASVGDNKTITVSFNKSGEGNENYTVPASYAATTAGAITKKDLGVITGNSVAKIRYYDGTKVAKVIDQGTFSGVCAGDDVLPKTTASFETADLGFAKKVTVTVTPEGADMANYTGGNSVTDSYDGWIKQKPLSITDPTLTISKEWDGNTAAAVTPGTLSGVVEGEDVTVTAVATYQTSDIGTNKNITVVYTLGGTAAGNYVKPTDYNCQSGEIYQGFGVQKATYDGANWSAEFTDVTVTKPPTGYTIFAVDNDDTIYASASDGSIQKLSGSTWSAAYSGTLPQGNFKLAGIDHGYFNTAMGIDTANGKVYYLNGTTWTDNGTTITPPDGQFVGAYSIGSNFYLVFSKDNQLGQVNLDDITSIATLAASPTIPAGYHICGFNYTDGKLNCYICK